VGVVGSLGGSLARHVGPNVTGATIRNILERAIDGVGPIPGAAAAGDSAVRKAGGNADSAIEAMITRHIRLAGAQGFLTNVGGLLTMPVAMPANLAAVTLIQCHLAAAILHVRGYDLTSAGVRDAVLVCLLDPDARRSLAKEAHRNVSPAVLAAATADPTVDRLIGRAVAASLLTGIGGKRLAGFAARRVPVLGGAIGGAGDAWATRRIGRETARTPRPSKPDNPEAPARRPGGRYPRAGSAIA
jgi:hypothetical protein